MVKKYRLGMIVTVILLLSLYSSVYADEARMVNIKEGDEWRYFKGITEPPDKWYYRDFDESTWQTGNSGFGYGNDKNSTLLDDMKGQYQTVYARKKFAVMDHNKIKSIVLSVVCDGPFIAYLNMIEVIRSKKQGRGDDLVLSGFAHELDPGTNVLSIQCSNDDIHSDNFSFIPAFQLKEE